MLTDLKLFSVCFAALPVNGSSELQLYLAAANPVHMLLAVLVMCRFTYIVAKTVIVSSRFRKHEIEQRRINVAPALRFSDGSFSGFVPISRVKDIANSNPLLYYGNLLLTSHCLLLATSTAAKSIAGWLRLESEYALAAVMIVVSCGLGVMAQVPIARTSVVAMLVSAFVVMLQVLSVFVHVPETAGNYAGSGWGMMYVVSAFVYLPVLPGLLACFNKVTRRHISVQQSVTLSTLALQLIIWRLRTNFLPAEINTTLLDCYYVLSFFCSLYQGYLYQQVFRDYLIEAFSGNQPFRQFYCAYLKYSLSSVPLVLAYSAIKLYYIGSVSAIDSTVVLSGLLLIVCSAICLCGTEDFSRYESAEDISMVLRTCGYGVSTMMGGLCVLVVAFEEVATRSKPWWQYVSPTVIIVAVSALLGGLISLGKLTRSCLVRYFGRRL